MPKIRRIKIKNFRSIRNLDIEVTDLATFVGDNDSGKSNILKALNLFFNDVTESNQKIDFSIDFNKFVKTNKRKPRIEIELIFELPDRYQGNNGEQVRWKKSWRENEPPVPNDWVGLFKPDGNRRKKYSEKPLPKRSKVPSLLSRIEFEYIPAIRGPEFLQTLRGRIYKVISEVSENEFRKKSEQFEDAIKANVSPLLDSILDEISDSTDLKLPNDLSQIFESLDFLSGKNRISLNNRGDGIKGRYIPLILKFIADQKKSLLEKGGTPFTFIWAYEEPENNLEFRRAQELAVFFERLAKDNSMQLLITTHSPVFFNMGHSEQQFPITSCYVVQEKLGKGTAIIYPSETNQNLDDTMGVMPIIAPYVKKAQIRIEELESHNSRLIEAIDLNHHAIFVEGITDYTVIDSLTKAMNIDIDEIQLVEPPERAGANYVTNMLCAWEYRSRSIQRNQRRYAVGILDCDEEGRSAAKRFNNTFNNKPTKYTVAAFLEPNLEMKNSRKVGLTKSICLEEMYPIEWWQYAKKNNWLEKRNKFECLDKDANIKIVEEKTNWETLIKKCPGHIIVTHRIQENHKVDFAKWVTAKPNKEILCGLKEFAEFLEVEFGKFKV